MNEHLQKMELRSEDVQSIMKSIPAWTIRWGGTIVVVVMLLLLSITWFIKYPDIIKGTAIITTKIPPEKHYSKVFGKIDTLFVAQGDSVNIGQSIAVLENNSDHADVLLLRKVLDTIKMNKKTFYFPFDNLPFLFLGELEMEYAAFENSYIQYHLNARLNPLDKIAKSNESSINELQHRLKWLVVQRNYQIQQVDLLKSDLTRHKNLLKKGVISKSEFESKQLTYINGERQLAFISSTIHEVREAINDAKIDYTDADFDRQNNEIVLRKKLVQNYNLLKRGMKDWEQNYLISSSFNGRVSFNKFWSSRQTIKKGELVCTILPFNNDYVVRIKTMGKGTGKIVKGLKVNIDLDKFPAYENGTLQGIVNLIPAVPEEDGSYMINAKLSNNLMTTYHKKIEFTQEMKGSAEIITKDISLAQRLFFFAKDIKKN